MKPIIEIYRDLQDENQTLGTLKILGDNNLPLFSSLSLERGWRDNKSNVSCIPRGVYKVVLEYSPRFKRDLWEIKGVENRSECKFHSANFWHQLNGCVALGRVTNYIDDDDYLDITNSKMTMRDFHYALRNEREAILIIKGNISTK